MSSEREIVEKFKEAVETKNMDSFAPYLAEDATIQMLPSTFVIIPPRGTSCVLSAMIQGRAKDDWRRVDQHGSREGRCRGVLQGQDLVTK